MPRKPSIASITDSLYTRSNALWFVGGNGNEYQLVVFKDGAWEVWDAYTGTHPYTPEQVVGGILTPIIRCEERTFATKSEANGIARRLLASLYASSIY